MPVRPSRACIITIFKVVLPNSRDGMNRPTSFRQRSNSSRRGENTALGWLGHDMRGAGVLATARKHLQIQYAVAAVAGCCSGRQLENQRLLLVVPGPAHAAKLRQLAPRASRKAWRTKAGTLTKLP